MEPAERCLELCVDGEPLVGIAHDVLDLGNEPPPVAVIVVVGGGQYRVGAHRLFVQLARHLASRGVPVLRFDLRGMGDSVAQARHYLDTSADLDAAIDAATRRWSPTRGVVLWGLCDGATASVLHAPRADRMAGVVLVNPWVSTEVGRAQALLKHHYGARLLDRSFWRSLVRGEVALHRSASSLASVIRSTRKRTTALSEHMARPEVDVVERVLDAIADERSGAISIIVSERDLTAREFEDAWHTGRAALDPRCSFTRLDADHTFSRRSETAALLDETLRWLTSQFV